MSEKPVIVFVCGPSSQTCRCRCPDFCEHSWTGAWDEAENSQTCARCGMLAVDHDMRVLP